MRSAAAALALLALGGCVTHAVPMDNPASLPPRAIAAAHALERLCLPVMSGETSEREAVRAARYWGFPTISFPDPPTAARQYDSNYFGHPVVSFSDESCLIRTQPGEPVAFRKAVEDVLAGRLGPGYPSDPELLRVKPVLPDETSFCLRGLRYAYYPTRGRYEISVARMDCERIRQVQAR
jgi:hypothetical protein